MNRKGISFLTYLFAMAAFWVVWIFFIGPFVTLGTQQAIASGNVSGLGAFILANLNLIIGIASVLGLVLTARQ